MSDQILIEFLLNQIRFLSRRVLTMMSINDAISRVDQAWDDDVAAGVLAQASVDKYHGILSRFLVFTAAHDVYHLAEITSLVVEEFIHAPGRSRNGSIVSPSTGTLRNRRNALRAFIIKLQELDIRVHDFVGSFVLPAREDSYYRPLTLNEALSVMFYSDKAGNPSKQQALTALLLCGVRPGEIPHLRWGDINHTEQSMYAHGTKQFTDRVIPLTPEAYTIVTNWVLSKPTSSTLFGGSVQSVGNAVRHALTLADITDPRVTVSSLTYYAGRKVWDATGRIELAALRIGAKSLDQTAANLNINWQGKDLNSENHL